MSEPGRLDDIDTEAFFEGVNEMRAYLERHIHDPVRRLQRLRHIAQELLRSRSARGLAAWLGNEIGPALGASACQVWIHRPEGWQLWHRLGHEVGPRATSLLDLAGPELYPTQNNGLIIPVPGLEGLIGAIWLAGSADLDVDSRGLLQAIAGTAGMALEQALRVESLARDPITGLLSTASFIDQAGAELRQLSPTLNLALLVIRLPGNCISFDPVTRELLAPGTPATVKAETLVWGPAEDLFAVPAVGDTGLGGEQQAQDLAATIGQRLAGLDWRAVYAFCVEPIDDLPTVMGTMTKALDEVKSGDTRRITLG